MTTTTTITPQKKNKQPKRIEPSLFGWLWGTEPILPSQFLQQQNKKKLNQKQKKSNKKNKKNNKQEKEDAVAPPTTILPPSRDTTNTHTNTSTSTTPSTPDSTTQPPPTTTSTHDTRKTNVSNNNSNSNNQRKNHSTLLTTSPLTPNTNTNTPMSPPPASNYHPHSQPSPKRQQQQQQFQSPRTYHPSPGRATSSSSFRASPSSFPLSPSISSPPQRGRTLERTSSFPLSPNSNNSMRMTMMTSSRSISSRRKEFARSRSSSLHSRRSWRTTSRRSISPPPPPLEEPKASKTLILIWILVGSELGMDLVTTAISFMALYSSTECCGLPIDFGYLTLAITIPYLTIVLIELCILTLAIKNTLCWTGKNDDNDEDEDDQVDIFEDEHGQRHIIPRRVTRYENAYRGHKRGKMLMRIVNFAVLLNPFLGCIICYVLLYQTDSKNEAFSILGLEGGSILLQWITFLLERERLNYRNFVIHVLPLIPFTITIGLIFLYLRKGGVCYRVDEGTFFFEGCLVCEGGIPAEEVTFGRFECPDNSTASPENKDYCSDTDGGSFCWFDFS